MERLRDRPGNSRRRVLYWGIVGFLFGIPQPAQGSATSTGNMLPHGNTNLYQVSDWLTKIIVDVGLVEIGRSLPVLTKLAESMKAPLGGQASSAAYGIALTITYAMLGFFYLYLWSHTLFPPESTPDSSVEQKLDLHDSDRSAAARDQYAALLAVQERVLGAEHPDALTTRANLASWTQRASESQQHQDGKPK